MASLKPLWLSLPSVAERIGKSRVLDVACDFDGTLAPIADHPDQAEMPSRTRAALSTLARLPRTRTAVFSGRPLHDLVHQARLEGALLTGSAGFEACSEDGAPAPHATPHQVLPAQLQGEMAEWCTRFAGAWLEDKGPGFALHYRAVPVDLQPAFCAGVRRRLRQCTGSAVMVAGKKVFEVLPPPGWSHVQVMRSWLEGREEGTVVFVSDEAADDPVHHLVRERNGIAVAIGCTRSRAEFVVSSTHDVTWLLEWLAREWSVRLGAQPLPVPTPT